MSKMHLNEEQLQRYALDELTDAVAAEHIAACTHCRMQINAYRMVYSHIREAEAPVLDFNPAQLVPDLVVHDRKEPRFFYSLVFGVLGLFIGVIIGCWNMISWVFSGITSAAFILGLLLLLGLLAMRLMELFGNYQEKADALNLE